MSEKQKLVVIGNGMAGVVCVEQILRFEHEFEITIFGEETYANYNRILLSSVLAGERSADEIMISDWDWYRDNDIALKAGVRIVEIDREAKTLVGDDDSITPYDKLIIATGSSPFIPPFDGVDKEGVFAFRNRDDTRGLLEGSKPGTKAVVIGGGLLGLEAARGLKVQGCDVTVVHLADWLMERQLDSIGGRYLIKKMEHMGVTVRTGAFTSALTGNGHVQGVEFKDGKKIDADIVVIAAGIRPNSAIGKTAGIEVNRSIDDDDFMQTSDPDIYSVGKCVEHRGQLFGLVAPLMNQGKVLAATITGNECAPFEASTPAAKLKIMGVDVFSAGEVDDKLENVDCIRYENPSLGVYKKLVLRDNKLAGVVLVGDANDSNRYTAWLRSKENLSGMRGTFLFPISAADDGLDIAQVADSETVCGCHGVVGKCDMCHGRLKDGNKPACVNACPAQRCCRLRSSISKSGSGSTLNRRMLRAFPVRMTRSRLPAPRFRRTCRWIPRRRITIASAPRNRTGHSCGSPF
jgi:nitrite reductase (NADH) large subunit